jgi:acyl-CoA synthetase (AMP-forming)/AMP-acid ligase II
MAALTWKFSLANVVRRFREETPNAPALSDGTHTITFSQLDVQTSKIAQFLISHGVTPGSRVAIMARNSTIHFATLLAISKVGAVAVGINFRLSSLELTALLDDADPALMFVDPESAPLVPEGFTTFVFTDALEAQFEEFEAEDPEGLHPGDIALQLYSSGTTGLPKGTLITNQNLSWTPKMGREFYRMSSDSVNLLTSPLFHIGGIGYGMTAFGNGAHTIIAPNMEPSTLLGLIEQYRITNAFWVPTVIRFILNDYKKHPADLSSLKLVAYGAAPIDDATLLEAIDVLSCEFLGVYGMTETAGSVTALDPEDHDPGGPRSHLLRSVGKALPWHRVLVFNPETLEPCETDEIGEIWIQSDQNMVGYWQQPDLTAEVITQDGWFRTGDAGWLDPHGFLFMHDRIKDMIISGGENVYPAEVERVLNTHPQVSQAIVIGVPHERWGETVKAVVIATEPIEESDLIAYARERLAHYKCPTSVVYVDSFPLNAAGKILKRELRIQYGA